MILQTAVDTQSDGFSLTHGDHVLMLGSCFAQEVGKRLSDNAFRVAVNPFGVLYNPASIAHALDLLTDAGKESLPDDRLALFQSQGLWRSWFFGTDYAADEREDALRLMNGSMNRATAAKWPCDVLMLTLGTNRAYLPKALNDGGKHKMVAANCHKMPDRDFEVWDMSIADIVDILGKSLVRLMERSESLRIVLTVSPYRYAKYGFHGNQLSKATLLLAVEALQQKFGRNRIHYFPAYELLMDEMRDYRFYGEDMLHPSATAVNIVWERFTSGWVSERSRAFMKDWEKCRKMMEHKLLRPDSDEARRFKEQTRQRMAELCGKYPEISLNTEL